MKKVKIPNLAMSLVLTMALFLMTAIACAPAQDAEPLDLEPQATVAPRVATPATADTPEPPDQISQSEPADDRSVTPEQAIPSTLPPPNLPTRLIATAIPPASPTTVTGGVFIAPKAEDPTPTPTATPPPPTPTPDLSKAPVRWTQFTMEEYLSVLPDPSLGVSWGVHVGTCNTTRRNQTPEGIRQSLGEHYNSIDIPLVVEDGKTPATNIEIWDALKQLEPWIKAPFPARYRFYGRQCTQIQMIHPEIPVAAVIFDTELVKSRDESVYYQVGYHYIVKDEWRMTSDGEWRPYQPVLAERIGPLIIQEVGKHNRIIQ